MSGKQQQWIHLYSIVKSEIDEYVTKYPKALKNILNFKKMAYIQGHQKTMDELKSNKLSRPQLLSKMKKYLSEIYHLLYVPLIYPDKQFIRQAKKYFMNDKNKFHVLYDSYHDSIHHRIYDYYILKTTYDCEFYQSDQIYLIIYLRNDKQIIEVLQL